MALKFNQLAAGEYIVTAYEEVQSTYGISYLIETQEGIKFFSNRDITRYIQTKCPKRKFKIEVIKDLEGNCNKVKIDNWKSKVILL